MTLAFWVMAYGFVGLGLAIAILMDEVRCPKTSFELFMIWIFWLPMLVGFGMAKLFMNVIPPGEQKYVKKVRGP